jgi:DNA-binding CsgD family transcriptional regulator
MKGGIIRGNTNCSKTPYPLGGGVLVIGSGIFSMEGGIIMNNSARVYGGGVGINSASTFIKTGGIIYGSNAPVGYQNIVVEGSDFPLIHGHAVHVHLNIVHTLGYRNDMVGENDNLTYHGTLTGEGIFGQGEKWSIPNTGFNRLILVYIFTALALIILSLLYVWKKTKKRKLSEAKVLQYNLPPRINLTPREKEVFNLLMSGLTANQCALNLNASISSINFHTQNIYRKLGIQSRAELLVKFEKGAGKTP